MQNMQNMTWFSWAQLLFDWWICRVSSRTRFCSVYFVLICRLCKINIQNMLICKSCIICIYLHGFAYCTYFAYAVCIAQLHLFWSEDAMNTDTTSVQRDRRQALRGVRCILVFKQKTSNFIRKHRKHCILAHLSSIAMQNHFPSQSMATPVVSATSSQAVWMKRRTLARFHMLTRMPEKSQPEKTGSEVGSFFVPAICSEGHMHACPVIRIITVVYFVSIINSRCNKQKYD